MCTIAAAFGALSSVASFAGESQAAAEYNNAARQNAVNASLAAQNKYEDAQRKYIYDSKATQKEGYQATLKGRSSVAVGRASAGSAGIDASSISLANLIAAEEQTAAENISRTRLKQEDLTDSFKSEVRSYEAEAKNRIASMPFKSGPNPLGLAIGIAGSVVKGGQEKGWWGGSSV